MFERVRVVLFALAALLAAAVLVAVRPAPAAAADAVTMGAAVIGWAANGGANQQWQLQLVS
jgi:hypothetical protein